MKELEKGEEVPNLRLSLALAHKCAKTDTKASQVA